MKTLAADYVKAADSQIRALKKESELARAQMGLLSTSVKILEAKVSELEDLAIRGLQGWDQNDLAMAEAICRDHAKKDDTGEVAEKDQRAAGTLESVTLRAQLDADEQIFERGSEFTYEEFAQLANVRWQDRVKQFSQVLDERSHLLGVLAVYREQEDQLKAELRRIASVMGEIIPCTECDGSGYDARGSACCRIPGHAKKCSCQVCLWMRSHYADQAEIKRLKRAGAILARFAWDHADDTEDKHLEAAELFREEWRAMLAEIG